MNGALCRWRDGVVEQLREAGLHAVPAMDAARAGRWREAVAAVAVSRVACAPGGFQDYLGTWTDPETGREREVYGRAAELTLAVEVFAPRDGGGDVCQRAAERVAEILACRGAAGTPALEVCAGRTEFVERDGLYRQEVTCRCGAWLTARTDGEAGTFTDFEVRGRVR